MKKGDIVISSGLGKTKNWNQTKGIITIPAGLVASALSKARKIEDEEIEGDID